MDDEVEFSFHNYPVGGTDATIRTVLFGGFSETSNILIEINPETAQIAVTVGNGPDHEDAPTMIAETLRGVADAVQDLADAPEYWEQLKALREQE
jgi:hypothetical protein